MKTSRLDWTPAEDAVLRPIARSSYAFPGRVTQAATGLDRTIAAIYKRIGILRRRMQKQNGAEGGTAQKAVPDRVLRVVPSAAAPVSGHDGVSSQTLAVRSVAQGAGAVSPVAGAPPGGAPAALSGPKRPTTEYMLAQRRALKADLDAVKRPPPENIERKCCACREVFLAASRYLFRCERCRGGGDLPAQYQSAASGRRALAVRDG